MKCRTAHPADAAALAELGAATFAGTFQSLYSPEDLAWFLSEWHSEDYYHRILNDCDAKIWVIEDEEGALQGYCKVGPNTLPCNPPLPEALELSRLYMRSSLQGAGWGAKLMNMIFDYAAQRSYRDIVLSVYAENHGAQRFYARYGFVKTGDYEFKVGNHYDPEYIYQKSL